MKTLSKPAGRDIPNEGVKFERCTVDQTSFKKMLLVRKAEAVRGIPAKK